VATRRGAYTAANFRAQYVDHLFGYVDPAALRPLHIVADAGNGCAGLVLRELEKRLPFTFLHLRAEPDGRFPDGAPNPLLPENRSVTSRAVAGSGADFGLAWDGDFDRCFFYDAGGNFIEGYYLVGLLARTMLTRHPGSILIHDPRLTWNTVELARQAGGIPVESKTGHAFIKERMRLENAVYGGEMSAHHYFRDFAYCDNGMIPWLLVAELVCRTGKPLAELVEERKRLYPCSGEINLRVHDSQAAVDAVRERFAAVAPALVVARAQATYLIWIDCRALGYDGNLSDYLTEHARVVVNDGSDYGTPGFIRLNIAMEQERLEVAIERLLAAFAELGGRQIILYL
jgi:phosphomannomutase/phosphoglucomutase